MICSHYRLLFIDFRCFSGILKVLGDLRILEVLVGLHETDVRIFSVGF